MSQGESGTYPPMVHEYSKLHPEQADYQDTGTSRKYPFKKDLSVKEANRFWSEKAKNFIKDHPAYFAKQLFRKLYYIFHNYRRHDLKNIFFNDHYVLRNYPKIGFAFIATLALMGIVIFIKNILKRWLILYSVLLSQTTLMLIAYVSDRQRAVMIPVLIFFAVAFISKLFTPQEYSVTALKNRSKPDLKNPIYLAAAILVIPLFLSLHHNNDVLRDELHRWHSSIQAEDRYLKAKKSIRDRHTDAAIKNLCELVAFNPYQAKDMTMPGLELDKAKLYSKALSFSSALDLNSHSHLFDLAYLYIENGQLQQAESIYLTLMRNNKEFNRQFTQSSIVEFYMARIAEILKKKDKSIEFLQKGLKKNPGDPWILAHLFAITNDPEYRDKLIRYFDIIDANYYIALARNEIYAK